MNTTQASICRQMASSKKLTKKLKESTPNNIVFKSAREKRRWEERQSKNK